MTCTEHLFLVSSAIWKPLAHCSLHLCSEHGYAWDHTRKNAMVFLGLSWIVNSRHRYTTLQVLRARHVWARDMARISFEMATRAHSEQRGRSKLLFEPASGPQGSPKVGKWEAWERKHCEFWLLGEVGMKQFSVFIIWGDGDENNSLFMVQGCGDDKLLCLVAGGCVDHDILTFHGWWSFQFSIYSFSMVGGSGDALDS